MMDAAAKLDELDKRTQQSEEIVSLLQTEIEYLEAGDERTFIMSKMVETRKTIQQLQNREKYLLNSNDTLHREIADLKQEITSLDPNATFEDDGDIKQDDDVNADNPNDSNDQNESKQQQQEVDDHGYANLKLEGKCQCEMCREGIATTHNDESHDQSLFGQFALDVDTQFTLTLVGGSTKCGRVMANYFGYLEITKKAATFKGKHCLEVGSGTGIVGCTVAYLGASTVMMTDQPGVTEILEENAKQLNQYGNLYDKVVRIGELLWGEEDAKKYVDGDDPDKVREWDVLIGSDLIYAHEFITPLVTTFEVLSNRRNQSTGKHPVVYMSVIRRFKWEENFFNEMANKFVQYKELEVGDICIYRYVRKEDVQSNH